MSSVICEWVLGNPPSGIAGLAFYVKINVAVVYPSIIWVLQIRQIFLGPITHITNTMHLILIYALNSMRT